MHDVVIVGAGLGGLTSGAVLAKKGFKVHVIEPHNKPGGFATTFRRKRYQFEVAIHVIDGPKPNYIRNKVFDLLDVDKNIEFIELPEFYECHTSGESVRIPGSIAGAKDALLSRFPHERQGLDQFFTTMERVYQLTDDYVLRKPLLPLSSPLFSIFFGELKNLSAVTAGQLFDRWFNDPLLKATLLATVTFYHDNAYELSAIQYLYALASYLKGGIQYVKGGSQVFSDYLAKIIAENGGRVDLRHEVTGLDVEHGQVTRVHYRKTLGEHRENQTTQAPIVICNAPMPMVYSKLLNRADAPAVQEFKKLGYSTSATNLFFGLKSPLQQLGNRSYLNIFIENKTNQLSHSGQDYSFGLIDNHVIDTGICPPGINTCEIIYMDSMNRWNSMDDYKTKKVAIQKYFENRMEESFPGFRDIVDLVEVGTPHTVQRYTSNPDGAIYGFKPLASNFYYRFPKLSMLHKPKDPEIKNLYFASAWSYMPGFSGGIIAGYQSALAVLDDMELGVVKNQKKQNVSTFQPTMAP